MTGDLALASRPDPGVRRVGLLHHRAEQAGIVGQPAPQDRSPEVDVAEDPRPGVGQRMVGGSGEEVGRHGAEVRRGGDPELFLGAEVMEEGPVGDARRAAEVVDRGRGIPLRPDHRYRGVEQPGLPVLARRGHSVHPTLRPACQPVGMPVNRKSPLAKRGGEALVDGAINEGVAAARLRARARAAASEEERAILTRIARDEARHARLGLDLVRKALLADPSSVRPWLEGLLAASTPEDERRGGRAPDPHVRVRARALTAVRSMVRETTGKALAA